MPVGENENRTGKACFAANLRSDPRVRIGRSVQRIIYGMSVHETMLLQAKIALHKIFNGSNR